MTSGIVRTAAPPAVYAGIIHVHTRIRTHLSQFDVGALLLVGARAGRPQRGHVHLLGLLAHILLVLGYRLQPQRERRL